MCVPACEAYLQSWINRRDFLRGSAVATAAAVTGCSTSSPAPKRGSTHADIKSIRYQRVVDLTHTLSPAFPTFSGQPQFSAEWQTRVEKDGFNVQKWSYVEHTGTHLDAPFHFSATGKPVNEIPASDLVCPLAVIDIRERAAQSAESTVTMKDITKWKSEHGEFQPGTCVAMRSGWDAFVGGPKFRNVDAKGGMHFPGFDVEAAHYLLEDPHVVGIAVDTLSLDIGATTTYGVHTSWLPAGRWGLECVAGLADVPPSGATIIVGAPKVLNGTGGPSRVFALV